MYTVQPPERMAQKPIARSPFKRGRALRSLRMSVWMSFVSILVGISTILAFQVVHTEQIEALSSPDTEAPRVPTGLSVTVRGSSVHATWDLGTEEDVFTYVTDIRPVGTPAKEELIGKTDSVIVTDLMPSRRVLVRVAAQDGAGNRSPFTPDIIVRTDGPSAIQNVHAWTPISADAEDVHKTVQQHAEIFRSLSPFLYDVQEDGSLFAKGEISAEIRAAAALHDIAIIPTVANVNGPEGVVTNMLQDEGKRTRNIESILTEVDTQGYAGIDINYEAIAIDIEDDYSTFIRELAQKLHERGKLLSVTVQPKKSDAEQFTGAAGISYDVLAEYADQVRLMTYDAARLNTQPGAIAPIGWVEERVVYALQKIPSEKLVVGLPLYGYDWCLQAQDERTSENPSACESSGITWDGVQEQLAKYNVSPQWDEGTKTPWYSYKDTNENMNIVHYEDARSIREKLERLRAVGIQSIVFWRLGSEDPGVFAQIAEQNTQSDTPVGLRIQPQDKGVHVSWDSDRRRGTWSLAYQVEGAFTKQIVPFDLAQNEVYIEGLENGIPVDLFVVPTESAFQSSESVYVNPSTDVETLLPVATATPMDVDPPNPISDVRLIHEGATYVDVAWTVPDTKDIQEVDLRLSSSGISGQTFHQAVRVPSVPNPGLPGQEQKVRVRGLNSGETYTLAVRLIDTQGNTSDVSNVVMFSTPDTVPPAVPVGLEGIVQEGRAYLSWVPNTEPDMDGYVISIMQGSVSTVDLKIDSVSSTTVIDGIKEEGEVVVQIAAVDEAGNKSEWSAPVVITQESLRFTQRAGEAWNSTTAGISAAAAKAGASLFSPGAVPYLVMATIILFNVFLFKGMRNDLSGDIVQRRDREIRHVHRTVEQASMGEIRARGSRVVSTRSVQRQSTRSTQKNPTLPNLQSAQRTSGVSQSSVRTSSSQRRSEPPKRVL